MGVTAVVALVAGAGALPGPKRLGLETGPAPTATTCVLPAGNAVCQAVNHQSPFLLALHFLFSRTVRAPAQSGCHAVA